MRDMDYISDINAFLYIPSIICHYSAKGCSDMYRISSIKEMRKILLFYHNTTMTKVCYLWRMMIAEIIIQIKEIIK